MVSTYDRKMPLKAVVLLVAVLGLGSTAVADQSSEEARHHFQAGTAAFNLGEFKAAADEYKAAYKLRPDPVFLYNIGQAYRMANDYEQALFFYRSYLHNTPDAANRQEVEERIRVLEEQRKKIEQPPNSPQPPSPETSTTPSTTTPPPPAAPSPSPSPSPSAGATPARPAGSAKLRLAGIVTGSVGVAALAAGIGLFVVGNQAADSQNHAGAGAVFDPTAESHAHAFQPAGVALMVSGGVLAVGGVTLFVIGRRGHDERNSVAARDGGAL